MACPVPPLPKYVLPELGLLDSSTAKRGSWNAGTAWAAPARAQAFVFKYFDEELVTLV